MLKNLFVFSLVRTRWSAVGFYFAWILFTMLLGEAVVLITMPFVPSAASTADAFQQGVELGGFTAVLISAFLTYKIQKDKNLIELRWVYVIASIVLAALGGSILGVLIPAYFTTRPENIDL